MKHNLWKQKIIQGLQPPEGSTFTVGMAVGSSLCMVLSLAMSACLNEPMPVYTFIWAGLTLVLGMLGSFVVKSYEPESMLHLVVFFTVGFSNLTLICALPVFRS